MTPETALYFKKYFAARNQRYKDITDKVEKNIEEQVRDQKPLNVYSAIQEQLPAKEFPITKAYATRMYELKQQEISLERAEQWRMQPHIRAAQTHLATRWGVMGAVATTLTLGQPLIGGAIGAALGSIHEEFTENEALRRAGGRSEEYTALECQIENLKHHTREAYFR